MELVWTRYAKQQGPSYYLLLWIGGQDGKIITLDADKVLDNDVNAIRNSLEKLRSMDLQDKLEWLRTNTKTSYNRALRTFKSDRLERLQEYDMKELKK
jgi:hypothetical protein